ncbi:hypothetical protein LG52_2854 [Geobacillus kaustophilus]|uniref:Uncharacterized protein n=1 Tax=Geobacillus kaustophilus TaxID=1462 RepID=A0A0D8BVP2_GEOKU|nr:hypothetical protein [Geobacillus kaustophilus]KJE28074.1 hypothetical protein LG52_2854 [Geobacillus kaustophilus]
MMRKMKNLHPLNRIDQFDLFARPSGRKRKQKWTPAAPEMMQTDMMSERGNGICSGIIG